VSAAAGDHHEPMAATALEAAETVWLHEHPHSSTAEAVEMVAPEPMDDAEDDRLPPASDLAISDTGLDIAAVPVSELADREVRAAEPVTAEVKRDTAAEPEPAAAAAPPAEDERQPVQYNIPEPHEVTGPPTNPRRGWWRR